MATSKTSAAGKTIGKRTARPANKAAPGKPSAPLAGRPAAARSRARCAFTLSALLMIGAERVIIDEVEDDNAHFMAEYIDPL